MLKAILLFLLLNCPFVAHAQTNAPEMQKQIKSFKNSKRFRVSYDKFDDATVVIVGLFFLDYAKLNPDNNFQMGAGFGYHGSGVPHDVNQFQLIFVANGDYDWSFLDDRTLKLIVDGERLSLGEADRTGKVGHNWLGKLNLRESMIVNVPAEVFLKLGQAKNVEMRLGRKEIKLKDEHLQAFRNLAELSTLQAATK